MQERFDGLCRLTPIQRDILMLAGLWDVPDEMQWGLIKRGRAGLVMKCGCDFLFDLQAWHDFLVMAPDQGHGYCGSGCEGIHNAVLSMQNDAWREALISANTETNIMPGS